MPPRGRHGQTKATELGERTKQPPVPLHQRLQSGCEQRYSSTRMHGYWPGHANMHWHPVETPMRTESHPTPYMDTCTWKAATLS